MLRWTRASRRVARVCGFRVASIKLPFCFFGLFLTLLPKYSGATKGIHPENGWFPKILNAFYFKIWVCQKFRTLNAWNKCCAVGCRLSIMGTRRQMPLHSSLSRPLRGQNVWLLIVIVAMDFFHDLGEWFIWNRCLNRRRAYLAVTITNYGFLAHGEPADGFLRSSFTKTKILMMIPSTTHRWCRMRK